MAPEADLNPAGQPAMEDLFSGVAPRYDLANRVLSLGRDPFWRLALARRVKALDPPGRLLDLASGTGDQIAAVKRVWPEMEVTGLDLTPAMLERSGPKFDRLPPPRPRLAAGDARSLPFPDRSFDSVSISFGLRNINPRPAVYREVRRVLKPGGRFLVLEMFHNPAAFWAPVVGFYLKHLVPRLGGGLAGRREDAAYRYLASSVLAFPGPSALAGEMAEAGFRNLKGRVYTFETVMLVWGDTPEEKV